MRLDLLLNQRQLEFSLFLLLILHSVEQVLNSTHHLVETGSEYPDLITSSYFKGLIDILLVNPLHILGQRHDRGCNPFGQDHRSEHGQQ
ncbi:hypothetical protein D3C75_892780 [compost metagenome]